MDWTGQLLLVFGLMILFMTIGVPVAFSMGLAALTGIVSFLGPAAAMQMANIAFERGTNDEFIVVPLFILMAGVISHSGIAEAMFQAANKWFNRVPGTLAVSTLATSTAFAAVSGSSPATAATVGIFAVPEMLRHKYPTWMAVGSVSAGGTLGILIPPSLNMVIYGIITETSIGKLFIAGILPGLFISLLLILYTIYSAARDTRRGAVYVQTQRVTWTERFAALRGMLGVVLLFLLVIGGIYSGAVTPTESAALGAAGAIVLALFYRKLTWSQFREALR
ncbi:MAG: TRAP transporter large permease subunit, partial [Alicyclobacillus sp.]|nr:TRAP transporter large permease subunit [Alicyclobacillus sp.]